MGERGRGLGGGHAHTEKKLYRGWKECLLFQGPFGRCFAYIYFDTVMISRLLRERSHLRRLRGLQLMLCLLTLAVSSLSARWPAVEPVPAQPQPSHTHRAWLTTNTLPTTEWGLTLKLGNGREV